MKRRHGVWCGGWRSVAMAGAACSIDEGLAQHSSPAVVVVEEESARQQQRSLQHSQARCVVSLPRRLLVVVGARRRRYTRFGRSQAVSPVSVFV